MKKAFLLSLVLLMGLSFVACGISKEQNEIIDEFEDEEKEDNDNEDTLLTFDLESTDDKTVITYSDTIKVVYYHDGENITDMEYYMNCGTAESAQMLYNTYKLGKVYDEDESVDSLDVKGKYIIINYNESAYEVTTVAELKELEEQYKQLQELYAQYQ